MMSGLGRIPGASIEVLGIRARGNLGVASVSGAYIGSVFFYRPGTVANSQVTHEAQMSS